MLINHSTSRFISGHLRQNAPCPALGAVILGALFGSVACSGEELDQRDLGNTENQLAASEGSDRLPVVVNGIVDPFVEGRWVGHAEDAFSPSGPDGERLAYSFPSGSTEITLELSITENVSFPGGQIRFGAGPVPVPQPIVAFPPGFHPAFHGVGARPELPLAPVEGFSYPLQEDVWRTTGDTGVAAGALSLGYLPNAAYELWCALQPPHEEGPGVFDCDNPTDDPNALCGHEFADGSSERVDCDVHNLCIASNICSCTESGCALAPTAAHQLWLVRDGDELVGSFAGTVFDYGSNPARYLPAGTVRFSRVAD